MCTYLRNTELDVQIAENDIEVYKIVKVKHCKWYAPFRNIPYESNELSSKLETPKKKKYGDLESDFHTINIGLHSYAYKMDAIHSLQWLIAEKYSSLIVVKATIPKNSRYYRSTIPNEIYVSDHLNLGEEIVYVSM